MQGQIKYRFVHNVPDLIEVVLFQEAIWGKDTATPLPLLIAQIHNGSMIIGAYSKTELIGFCYGFPGVSNGQSILVSHMMAIKSDFRNAGIGKTLKIMQRNWAKEQGFEKIVWTFDPLEARNAYLNTTKLGGYIRTYLPSYYGEMTDSLNFGLETDRFLLEWDIRENGSREQQVSLLDTEKLLDYEYKGNKLYPKKNERSLDQSVYLVAVPAMIHELKKQDIDAAKEWRRYLRECFIEAFSKGYRVSNVVKGNQANAIHYYVLEQWEDQDEGCITKLDQ
jgi:predicted GNAT superfamily acetyltransferase